jgi:hypothetical protein
LKAIGLGFDVGWLDAVCSLQRIEVPLDTLLKPTELPLRI